MIGAVAGPIYMSSIMPPFYNVGQTSGCAFRFNVAAENGFDCGAGLGALLAALLVWLGLGFSWLLMIGLTAGGAGVYLMLRNRNLLGVAEANKTPNHPCARTWPTLSVNSAASCRYRLMQGHFRWAACAHLEILRGRVRQILEGNGHCHLLA
ncbi:MAG: hypothetical protein U1E15_06465 [Hyphomicrobiales bacterium]